MSPTILPARRLAPERCDPHASGPIATSPGRGGEIRELTTFDLADRLVQAWSRNERRLGELDVLDSSIASARRRLATTAAGRGLVEAHLARLLSRRAACAAEARADASLAQELSREWDARHAMRRAVGG